MMTTNNNEGRTTERTAELYTIQAELYALLSRTNDLHNENVANGIDEWDTDETLNQIEAMLADVSELLAA